jgi:hypothetical protein
VDSTGCRVLTTQSQLSAGACYDRDRCSSPPLQRLVLPPAYSNVLSQEVLDSA